MPTKYPFGKGIVKWVSTDWLEEHVGDGDLMILDTQPNVHDYIQEHVPGAVYFNESLLRVPLKGIPARYVPPSVAQSLLRRVGLRADVPVVVYTGTGPFKGWGDGLEQTLLAYSLARFGHERIYVLDGGIDKWVAEQRPLDQAFPEVRESDFQVKVRSSLFVEYERFKSMKERARVMLLDARPPEMYEGQGPWRKPGHIPGAVNLPWKSLMTESNPRLLKSDDEIHAILKEHEISADKTIICSCGTGREATNEFLLFNWYLGYPKVLLHEGAFTEWTAYPENETVTGPSPR